MLNPSTWNVLIADDDADSADIAEYVLTYHGAHVRIARNGIACMEMLRQERPTLLLLDIQMPVKSGWMVLKEIREDTALKDLLVIAMTAHAMVGDRERILSAGFDAYLAKPISPISLIEDIKQSLEAKAGSRKV